jgi:adenine deaminase
MSLHETIQAARAMHPVDLLLRGGTLVNVLSGELYQTDVAVHGGRVVGLGEGYTGREEVDCRGKWIAPGFIDGHMHVESTLVTVAEFARAVLPRGTVAAIFDPHEIANVHGLDGIRYILDSRAGVPLQAFIMASSCVPATHMESAGATLTAADLAPLFAEEGVIGLAEVMNYPGVVYEDAGVLEKLNAAHAAKVVIDGHAPRLSGRDLNAYIAAGVGSDHEATQVEEAREKLRKGMILMIRESSSAKNLKALLPVVTPQNSRRCCFVTDDRHPADLLSEGHIDHAVRKAIALGLPPITAFQMASINTAEWFRLDQKGHGAIAPGWRADILVLDDLTSVSIERVYVAGQLVAEQGQVIVDLPVHPSPLPSSFKMDWTLFKGFGIPAQGQTVKVIEIIPGQIVTKRASDHALIVNEEAVADPARDLLKMAVVERHGNGNGVGLGFVRGMGMKAGAIASSVAHDSHNVVIAGVNDADMRLALETIVTMQGGLVVVQGGQVLAQLALPIAGLMSDRPVPEVRDAVERLHQVYHELGGELNDPFMQLAFLALPVIPSLKLTDKGLVDVEAFALVDLFEAIEN